VLVNFIGPPGSGKSTLLTMFKEERDRYGLDIVCVSIDQSRRLFLGDEEKAWDNIVYACKRYNHCIFESSGMSWRIRGQLLAYPVIRERGCETIILYGRDKEFLRRIQTREKPPVPFLYKNLTEESLIEYAATNLPNRYPTAFMIPSDDRASLQETYISFKRVITQIYQPFLPNLREVLLGDSSINNGPVSSV